MTDILKSSEKQMHFEEISPKSANGMVMLLLNILLMLASIAGFIFEIVNAASGNEAPNLVLIILCVIYFFIIGPILFAGLKILKPNEAFVLTLFGKYHGTLKGEGFFFVNPFVSAFHPGAEPAGATAAAAAEQMAATGKISAQSFKKTSKVMSLKTMTLHNERQKINDELGNPIIIGIVVRGSSQEVAEKLKVEIQSAVDIAGLEIMDARITHLAYAPEIAAAMLQRQQASAIIAARQMIVEGAVGMVEMALEKLSQREIVQLDEERKAAMVSNLLVVLCANKDAQPIVNSGSIY